MRARAPREHPEIPRLRYTFEFLDRAGVTDNFGTVVSQRARHFGRTAIVAGHGPEFADLRVDDRKEVLDAAAKHFLVFIEHVMRAGTEPDVGRNVPLVVAEHDVTAWPDDEIRIEPAPREFRHFFHDAATADVQPVLFRDCA